MEPIPPLSSDPEFRPVDSDRALPPVIDPAAYRRMIFNPFLGVLAIGGWLAAMRWALDPPGGGGVFWPAAAPLLVLVAVIPRLFQFHCLDCGRTGRISRWRAHLCAPVARRILDGRPLRFRTPGPLVQLLVWGYVLALVLALAANGGLTSR